jgi:hypothetical protein
MTAHRLLACVGAVTGGYLCSEGSVTRGRGVQVCGGPAAVSLCRAVTGAGGGGAGRFRWSGDPGRPVELWSGVVDFEALADGGGDGLEVAGVGADDQVAAAQGSLDDARVDYVGGGRAGGERAGGAGPGVV